MTASAVGPAGNGARRSLTCSHLPRQAQTGSSEPWEEVEGEEQLLLRHKGKKLLFSVGDERSAGCDRPTWPT